MSFVATAITATAVVGGALITSSATKSAAKTAQQGADQSLALQQRMYDETTARNAPYYETGTGALGQLATLYGLPGGSGAATDPYATFYQSPDYQFQFAQGIKGTDAGAAARGMLDSGATRKAEIQYAGNLAAGQYNTYAGRLMDLARVGQSAANNTSTAGQNFATSATNTLTGNAANQANATLANGGTYGNLAGQLGSLANNAYQSSYGPNSLSALTTAGIANNPNLF